jgi:hypothetical protein
LILKDLKFTLLSQEIPFFPISLSCLSTKLAQSTLIFRKVGIHDRGGGCQWRNTRSCAVQMR